MKCLNCQKTIDHEMPCIFCKNFFCSYKCLRSHIIFSHNNNLLINAQLSNKSYLNNNFNNSNQNKTDIILSPYLIEGIYYKYRNYDEKYNLENFIPILEDNKPKIIGGGSFGQVFLVANTINNKLYAIKHMIKANLSKKLNSLESIYKEIYIQSRIDHPNILPILYVKETKNDFDLVLEYAKFGSLFYYIRKRRYLDENTAFSLFIQVVNAVYFLHKNDLIHRDIKPENILIFENNNIKLCDFGWCVNLEQGQQRDTFCGTTEYMSPELVNHEEYSKEIDIWSLGVLLYEMVHGYSPFRPDKPNFNAKDVINNIRMHKLKFNNNISQRCRDLIYHLLDEETEKRYKIEDIFNSDFVRYYENKKYSFPDQFLIEKYKFKISKAQNILYPKIEKSNLNRCRAHNKSSSNIINPRNNIFEDNNLDNEFNDNISNIEKKINMMKNVKRKKYPSCLSQENLKSLNNNDNNKKKYERRLEKNKTFEYFPSLAIIDNKINISLLGNSKSNKNIQSLKESYNINNSKENEHNITNNYIKENKEINLEKEKPMNETKIKTIIINNYFPNMIPNNEYKNNNNETKNDLTYKKNFHVKPLKMSKIPINNKNNKLNLNISRKKLNSFLNFNYLMIKKHLSPKIKLITDNKKRINSSKEKSINENESKIIEVNRTNYNHSSKASNKIPYQFDFNKIDNKRIYTRNVNNYKYDSMKDNKFYYSRDNYSKYNISNSNINTNNNTLNNSHGNLQIIDNINDINRKRINNGRIHHTKSMSLLNVNFKNENIKSLFNSNVKNIHTNSISINSENKSLLNTIHKNNRINENNNNNLNLYGIKKVNTTIYKTNPNNPLNDFNNNFVHTINPSKILNNNKRDNISHFNNTNILNKFDLNKLYLLNQQNKSHKNITKENENEKNNKIPIKKLSILEIKNNSSVIIPQRNNKNNAINNENDKNTKNIPRTQISKKNDEFFLHINTQNNISKNCRFEGCICNNHINLSNKKNGSDRQNLSNKNHIKFLTRNNSNRENKNEKFKPMKKLDLSNFLSNLKSNRNKRVNNKMNKEYSLNNLNKKNESFLNHNTFIGKDKQEFKKYLLLGNTNKNIVDKLPYSQNVKYCQEVQTSNNNDSSKIIYKANNNNSKNRIKVLIREPKFIIASTIPRYKNRVNRITNNENDMNKLNLEDKNNSKPKYNGVIYKTENNSSIFEQGDDIYCICHN